MSIPPPSFLSDDRKDGNISPAPPVKPGGIRTGMPPDGFIGCHAEKRPAGKRLSSPNARRYRAGRRFPLPGTGKNFRHDTHPAKPSEIHERTKTSAKRPDNRDIPFAGRIGHHRCPPGMNRIPSVTTRISRSAGERPETGTLWRSCWRKLPQCPVFRQAGPQSVFRFPDNRIFPPARAVDSGRPDHGSGGREERAKSMTMTIPASAQNAPAPNTDE